MPESREIATVVGSDASKRATRLPERFYRPELDVVRFLAFLLVFMAHSQPHSVESLGHALTPSLEQILFTMAEVFKDGLSLFFILSAYLICELLLRESNATGAVLVKQFYIRRILRIWPLYLAGLGIAALFALLPGGDRSAIVWVGWSTILLGNWFIVLRGTVSTPMFPLWSISVEEQFYLFAPWAVKRLSRERLMGLALTLVVVANVCLFSLGRIHGRRSDPWYNSFVQFENFAAGMLLCLVLRGRSLRMMMWQRGALLAVGAFCWYFAADQFIRHRGGSNSESWLLIAEYGLIALGGCFFLVAFLDLDKKLLPAWAIYLGRISYGLYVFHGLALHIVSMFHQHKSFGSLIWLLKGVAAMGLTILFASFSYRYFETPFLRMKKRHEIIESRPV